MLKVLYEQEEPVYINFIRLIWRNTVLVKLQTDTKGSGCKLHECNLTLSPSLSLCLSGLYFLLSLPPSLSPWAADSDQLSHLIPQVSRFLGSAFIHIWLTVSEAEREFSLYKHLYNSIFVIFCFVHIKGRRNRCSKMTALTCFLWSQNRKVQNRRGRIQYVLFKTWSYTVCAESIIKHDITCLVFVWCTGLGSQLVCATGCGLGLLSDPSQKLQSEV